MKQFLCLIIERGTMQELAEYRPYAKTELQAKWKAHDMFLTDQKYMPRLRKSEDWYVDAVEL